MKDHGFSENILFYGILDLKSWISLEYYFKDVWIKIGGLFWNGTTVVDCFRTLQGILMQKSEFLKS